MTRLPWLAALLAIASPAAAGIRIVDAHVGANACREALGVARDAQSTEVEIVEFDGLTPSHVPVVCPKGFQAASPNHTKTGGSCSFQPAPGGAGRPHPDASHPSELVFSCQKLDPSECGGGKCTGTATVECTPIPMQPWEKISEACRTPGAHGQITSLSTGMSIVAVLKRLEETRKDLQSTLPVLEGASSPPPGTSPDGNEASGSSGAPVAPATAMDGGENKSGENKTGEEFPPPQQLTFPGKPRVKRP